MVCFFEFSPHNFGGYNFLNSNPFLTIFSMLDVPTRRVQILFGHQKQQSPPLGSSLPWALKCSFTSRSTRVLAFNYLIWMRKGISTCDFTSVFSISCYHPISKQATCANCSIIINRASHEFGSTPNGLRTYPITSIVAK